jgi:outer membrane protein assembly factor BamB
MPLTDEESVEVASPEERIVEHIPSDEAEAEEEEEEEWWITAVNPYHSGFVEGDLSPFDQEADWVYYPESGEGTGLVATRKQLVFAENNLLSALDSTTGEFLWETRLSSDVVATPSIYLEEETTFLFVPTQEGELYALNLADGRLLWHIRAEEIVGTMRGGITVGDDDLLYATTDAGWLYVLEPWSSEINWALELSDSEEFSYPPTPLNLAVFLAGDTGTIYAIDSTTREVAWEAETIGQPSTPLVTQESWNMLLIGTDEGWLQAFSSITGNLVWQAQTGSVIVDIALDWEQVYAITIEGTLIAWEAFEGKEIDTHAFESEPRALFTDGEILLVGTQEGQIRYLEIESGEENHDGRLELDEPLIDFSTVAGQWFFVRTEEAIYGFER